MLVQLKGTQSRILTTPSLSSTAMLFFIKSTQGCTIFSGKKPCRKSLIAGSPSCRSKVNYKVQTRQQDCGHVIFCGLRIAMKNLMLRVSSVLPKTLLFDVPMLDSVVLIRSRSILYIFSKMYLRYLHFLCTRCSKKQLKLLVALTVFCAPMKEDISNAANAKMLYAVAACSQAPF